MTCITKASINRPRTSRTDGIVGNKPWLIPQHRPICLLNAKVIDPVGGKVIESATVTARNGRITRLFTDSSDSIPPTEEDAWVVDLQGKYIYPGLIDGHSTYKNIPAATNNYRTIFLAREMLRRGFTTARDCGGADGALKEAIEEWLVVGPRLIIAGHALSQTGSHGDQRASFSDEDPTLKCCAGHRSGIGRLCDGPTECTVAVRDEIRKGADFIKIMGGGGIASRLNNLAHPQFLPAELEAITATAASFDTYVTAHAYTIRAMRHMLAHGVKGIEHGNFLDRDTAQLMVEKSIWLTPTLATHEALATPPYDRFLNEACQAKNQAVMSSGLEALKIASEIGVQVCFGSDLIAGMHQFQRREFAIRSQVLSALSILQSATVTCAKMIGREHELGQIKEGFLADMVILDHNPLEDITVLDRPETVLAVVKEGHVAFSSLDSLPVTIEPRPW
ncbi:hypothetical protein BDW74DRAFT_184605 [Aspergillus multicolor]|uniref:uncharacterized protein n=1 Tax=Aspergillus multicolor TaxID=41759 RepID=UPI003CCD471E